MKTERRHELQTNVLADWIGHKTEAIRPYWMLIAGTIGAIFLVAVVATVISNQQFESSSQGWADYFAASTGDSPDRLRSVAKDYQGTLPAIWASLREADLELARGISAMYTNRGEAIDALSSARKLYVVVVTGAVGQPALKQAAEYGTAQAYEAEGEIEKAIDYYEDAIATDSSSAVGKQAQARLELLKDKENAEWLVWFARQTPQPRTPSPDGTPAGFPGGFPGDLGGGLDLPSDLNEVPGRPDLSLPVPMDTSQRGGSFLPADPAEPPAITPADEPPAAENSEPKSPPKESEPPATPESPATPPAATPPAATPPADGAAGE